MAGLDVTQCRTGTVYSVMGLSLKRHSMTDGAIGSCRRFCGSLKSTVTVPTLLKALSFCLMTTVLDSRASFQIIILTSGGRFEKVAFGDMLTWQSVVIVDGWQGGSSSAGSREDQRQR